jgi:hypothetical protein
VAQSPSAPVGTAQPQLKWSAAQAPLPMDADPSQNAAIDDVYCPAPGDCVAVGHYTASGASGDVTRGLVETLSGGTWTPTAFPGVSSKKGVAMHCVMPVSYVGSGSAVVSKIETLSGGTWTVSGEPPPCIRTQVVSLPYTFRRGRDVLPGTAGWPVTARPLGQRAGTGILWPGDAGGASAVRLGPSSAAPGLPCL